MKPVYVDTSALIAIGNKNDSYHHHAVRIHKSLLKAERHFITTNGVILELFNTFSPIRQKQIAIRLYNLITNSENWDCIPVDELMPKGIVRFQERLDKDWSLVDCISMVAAENLGITEIFTTDHHFTQAGFNILLP